MSQENPRTWYATTSTPLSASTILCSSAASRAPNSPAFARSIATLRMVALKEGGDFRCVSAFTGVLFDPFWVAAFGIPGSCFRVPSAPHSCKPRVARHALGVGDGRRENGERGVFSDKLSSVPEQVREASIGGSLTLGYSSYGFFGTAAKGISNTHTYVHQCINKYCLRMADEDKT